MPCDLLTFIYGTLGDTQMAIDKRLASSELHGQRNL